MARYATYDSNMKKSCKKLLVLAVTAALYEISYHFWRSVGNCCWHCFESRGWELWGEGPDRNWTNEATNGCQTRWSHTFQGRWIGQNSALQLRQQLKLRVNPQLQWILKCLQAMCSALLWIRIESERHIFGITGHQWFGGIIVSCMNHCKSRYNVFP